MLYDVCVVGAGTMGSATAYHLSRLAPDQSLILVGPYEPRVKTPDHGVFGCHYDEGRITRVISPIESEQILALRSTLGYGALELETGNTIYSEVGFAVVGEAGDPDVKEYSDVTEEFCAKNSLKFEKIDSRVIREKWPYFEVPECFRGGFSLENNGYISVRKLVESCQAVFANNGGVRSEYTAVGIRKVGHEFEISLAEGQIIRSRKVVIACGSFTNFFNLLHEDIDCKLVGHTVMKFELSDEDAAKLINLPTLMYKMSKETADYIYILPPIRYPDGKMYLKFGHTADPANDSLGLAKHLETLAEIQEWHCMTDFLDARNHFKTIFAQLFPRIKPASEELDFCVMTFTETGKQYIDFVRDGLMVAVGGNGKSAKLGLEIGNICAKSILRGEWDYDLDRNQFEIRYKN